ncbi:MAG: FHA domain-containing protein [Chloroflexi bacterium]|nr:FHA domain-containing protein [Chloroflexota bacterium]
MALQSYLEVIGPGGDVRFIDIAQKRGIVNVGRHADNDIVIDRPGVASFHAVIDGRQTPFQIMLLAPEGVLSVRGEMLTTGAARALNTWDACEIGGYTIMVCEGEAGALPVVAPPARGSAAAARAAKAPRAAAPVAPAAAAAAASQALPPAATGLAGALGKLGIGKSAGAGETDAAGGSLMPTPVPPATVAPLPSLPADRKDDSLLLEIGTREWTIDVEQTIEIPLTVVNGGNIVAQFDISVQGIEPAWVEIIPPSVNLNERQRAEVTVRITPPRLPTSRAGKHFFSISVRSPNYPDRAAVAGATFTINKFYGFDVGELSPRQQSISYHKHVGEVKLTMINRGNSEMGIRLIGEDLEHGLHFEFSTPTHTASLARQAEFRLPSNAPVEVPVRITPIHRRMVALRNHTYQMSVTATPTEGQLTPRAIIGQVTTSPLFGKLSLLLMTVAILALVVAIFRPWIDDFSSDRLTVIAKQPVLLSWRASPFANLRIKTETGTTVLQSANGSTQVFPEKDGTTYVLEADNLLTRINAQWFGASSNPVTIKVVPVLPKVSFALTMPDGKRNLAPSTATMTIIRGESVTLAWEIQDADAITLSSNGAGETISSGVDKRQLSPERDTTYILVARNKYGEETRNLAVSVKEPPTGTPTPTPTIASPVIVRFDVVPQVITAGQTIKLDWEVSNANEVAIQGVEGANVFPAKGTTNQTPLKDTSYVLKAVNGPNVAVLQVAVVVQPAPTPTTTPVPPKIEQFQLTHTDVVRGSPDAADLKLVWLVSGQTSNISISGPDFPVVGNLSTSGQLPVVATKSTIFVITAQNGTLVASQSVTLNLIEPTPTPTPLPPPPPLPSITFFRLESASGSTTEVIPLPSSVTNTVKYSVIAGTNVKFSWDVQNSAKVTFVGIGDQPPNGNLLLNIRQQRSPYQLQAFNAANQSVSVFIDITVLPQPAPAAPINVTGTNGPNGGPPLTVQWSYAGSATILGFRLYRATVPSTAYSRIVDENSLKPTIFQFADPVLPACGRSYYVVAVYQDILTGDIKETARSVTTWYSRVCP